MVYFSWLRESLYKQPSRGVDRCSVVVVNMASWGAVWCWSIARVEPDWGILNHLSKSPAFNSANFWERLSKRICTREFFFAASFFLIHRPKRVETSKGPQPTRQLTWSIAQKCGTPKDHNRHDNLHDPSPKTCGTPKDHNRHDNLHDPSPKTFCNLATTTTDTTTYMIHRPKRVALPRTTTDTTTYMIHCPNRVALPRTTTDTTTYMIHRPKRVETSKGPQPTRQLTWSIAQNVWQPPNDHNWHDNLHDPSPKTCGTPNDHNRHDNLHDPSPKTCGTPKDHNWHDNLHDPLPKPCGTPKDHNWQRQLTWSIAQNVWKPPKDHNRHDNLHDPSPKTCGNLPTTTTDTTTYMIHRQNVWHSQRPQPTRQLTWSIAQNVWQPPNDHNRHDNLHDPSPKTCGNLPRTTTDTTHAACW